MRLFFISKVLALHCIQERTLEIGSIFPSMLKACLLSLALILGFRSNAQVKPRYTNFEHYTTEDGLPQNYVSSIVQDQDGFIWVATLDGIARFDGYTFREFNISSETASRISTPRVLDLKIDQNNNLWILHFNQTMDLMDPQTFEVKRDLAPVKTSTYEQFPLAMGYRSMFYFSFGEENKGPHWFVKNETNFHLFDSTDFKLSKLFSTNKKDSTFFFGFDEDDEGRLWVLDRTGIQVSDSSWKNFKKIAFPSELGFEVDSVSNLSLITQMTGKRMLIFVDERLLIYNEQSNRFRELTIPIRRPENANHAVVATRDQEGRVIFSYFGYVFRVNEDESISTLWKYPGRDRYIISNLLIAKDGSLLVGVNTGGLYIVNMNVPSFQSKNYDQNFLVDVLTNELDVNISQIPENWLQNKGAYDFIYYYSHNGRLYFAQDGYYFGRHNRIFYLEDDQIRLVKSKPSMSYFKGIYEEDGVLSAIDSYGFHYQWTDIATNPEIDECVDLGNPTYFLLVSLTHADGYTWIIDNKNRIFQVDQGQVIQVFDVGDKNFSLQQILKVKNSDHSFWITTYGGGLLKWNYQTNVIEKVFTTKEGLPDNTIAAMVSDDFGNIWLSTFNGITKFNPISESFINYTTSDGLIQSEFDRHHGFKLPDGRIAFGASEGYSVFNPRFFVQDTLNPEVKLTKLLINNREQVFGDSLSIIQKPVSQLSKLELTYDNNSLTMEFAAMQYGAPSKIEYRYKMSGYTEEWIKNGSDRRIKFDKLRTGSYTLSVNASNTNGVWSQHVKEFEIHVLPPPWMSWWAYTLYSLAVFGLVFLYWRNYRRKLVRKQEEEFARREAIRLKEVDDMKTRFFSNITHEFRTPLTLILSPLEKQLRDKKYPEDVQKILESNYRHGSHLLKLVNELLDISKLEGGFMQIHRSTGQLDPFLQGCVDDFKELAEQKQIDLSFESKNITGYHQFDKSHVEKVVQNLLSNAIKFTDKQGKVGVHAEVTEGSSLILAVQDTGIGIPAEQIPQLFDRFFQVDDTATRANEGTGIGLSLVKELTDLMEGSVSVESQMGKGTSFKVVIPVLSVSLDNEPIALQKTSADVLPEGVPLILVVEDNAELRSFIVESLSKEALVIEGKNGREGWEVMVDRIPDVVVSDVMMPEMDGYELCRKAKTDNRTSHISFILLTAKTAQESKEKGLESGADDYLTKPFHMYELELRIQNSLKQQSNVRNHLRQELFTLNLEEKKPVVKDAFLRALFEKLEENLSNKNISVDWLASQMSMSQSTLNRKLKSLIGLSAGEFIRHSRLQKAVELMGSGQTIAEIAFHVGFESPSYFSQCFKEAFNRSPSEYQKEVV